MRDAAVFHAALTFFTSLRANTLRVGLPREITYHQVECSTMISNRLRGSASLHDETICAVILLWAFEVRTEVRFGTTTMY